MELWTAFLLGLVGSLHCAGMCGPLALAMPATGGTQASFVLGRAAYNFGRIFTYCSLGALFGLAGRTLALAGLWLDFAAAMESQFETWAQQADIEPDPALRCMIQQVAAHPPPKQHGQS